MSAAAGPSFISYLSEAERDKRRDQKLAEAMTKIYKVPEKELEDRLLAGEIAIAHANKVMKYYVHDDPTRGISGTLVCTNFRLIFITAEKATYDLIELKNRIIHEHDVLLNNIESIFVEYPNKRKKLVTGSKVKDNIQRLELHCKDFRVAAFNFKLTVKGEEKGVITSLLHHAYPQTLTRLFAFDYQHGKNVDEVCKIPLYRTPSEWDSELRRCGVKGRKWRTSVFNRKLQSMETMSPYFVVPGSIKDSELGDIAQQYVGDRIPIWCWSDSNGCSLIRGSTLRPETELQECEIRMHEAIRVADPNKRPLKIVNVSKSCPSCLQLQQSFNKLKSMCMPATEADFWEGDSRWPSCASKWLQHVSTVLSIAEEAAEFLRKKKHNVIIQEAGGPDLSSVVTSLVQLMLDPTCRMLDGFQALIQREWVVAGHPFLDRLGHLLQPTKKRKQVTSVSEDGNTTQLAPVFLLFLDCVYQLMVQFPASFESSVTFLIVLYDATRTTTFETFIFNHEKQRRKCLGLKEWIDEPFASHEVDRVPTTQLLPVWAWGAQYNATDMALFKNPLYKTSTMTGYKHYVKESANGNSNCSENSKKRVPTAQLNGDVPDSAAVFSHTPRDLDFVSSEKEKVFQGDKKKTGPKDIKIEEHRRKLLKDSPIPIKVRQKSASLEENLGRRIQDSEKHTTAKKEPYKATSGGHYPKVALMPNRNSSATAPTVEDTQLKRHQSRSKSDSECNDDAINQPVRDDVVTPHVDEGLSEPSKMKTRTRFSIRRKKKGSYENEDASKHDVPTYRMMLKNKSVQSRPSESNDSVDALHPATNVAHLKLWRQCYFRWLPWSQIYGGGPASMLQQESLLYDEIHALHCKLRMLKRQLHGSSSNFHMEDKDESLSSGVYFAHSADNSLPVFETNSHKSSSQNSLNILSSYFPYSPIKELRGKSVLGTPMSNFLQGGSLFNFGRNRAKHSRSASNISITHSLSQSIEDLSSATVTDGTPDTSSSPATKSLEDLTSDGSQGSNIRDRTQSDVPPGRRRLKLLEPGAVRPNLVTPPTTPIKENITYITSL